MKVSELKGEKLDYWTGISAGYTIGPVGGMDEQVIVVSKTGQGIDYLWKGHTCLELLQSGLHVWNPTKNWSQLGPLIEKCWMGIHVWMTVWFGRNWHEMFPVDEMRIWFCRAIVASKYEVEFKYEEGEKI